MSEMVIRKSNFLRVYVMVVALAIVVGCGGGGGGVASSGGFGFTPKPGQYIEFGDAVTGDLVDPLNLEVGDDVRMVLANYDGLGNRTVLTTSQWLLNTGFASFSLNSSTGRFTVISNPGTFVRFSTTAMIAGSQKQFVQDAYVPVNTPTVVGRVVEMGAFTGQPSNIGIAYLQVDFFNISGIRIGSGRTDGGGYFDANVPATATHMMVLSDTISTSYYYKSVYFSSNYYSPLLTTCRVPLDAIQSGVNILSDPLAIPTQSGGPPPPPAGCP